MKSAALNSRKAVSRQRSEGARHSWGSGRLQGKRSDSNETRSLSDYSRAGRDGFGARCGAAGPVPRLVRSGFAGKADGRTEAGEDSLLYDLTWSGGEAGVPAILASSSRIRDERLEEDRYSFVSESLSDMTISTRIRVLSEPLSVMAGVVSAEFRYDSESGTVLVRECRGELT